MLNAISRTRVIGGWVATIIVAFAFSVFGGVDLTVSTGLLWLVMFLTPPAVLLLLWPGAPVPSVAEMLHSDDTRRA